MNGTICCINAVYQCCVIIIDLKRYGKIWYITVFLLIPVWIPVIDPWAESQSKRFHCDCAGRWALVVPVAPAVVPAAVPAVLLRWFVA